MTLAIGIGIGVGFGGGLVAAPISYPAPPWVDDLTDPTSLGWQQFGSETNVGTFGAGGFDLTVQDGNDAVLAPVGAMGQHAASVAVDTAIKGVITPGAGAAGILQAARLDTSANGYVGQLSKTATTATAQLFRLDAGVGTLLGTLSLDPAVAWGGVWLKTEASGSDTRLRVYVLHSDGTWRLVLDVIDYDATDDDHAGWPMIGMLSVGGKTGFALTSYEGTTDAGKAYTETVLMESSFTGAFGSIHGQPADTTGTGVFNVIRGAANRNGSGRLIGTSNRDDVFYDAGAGQNRVEGEVKLTGINAQDRLGLYIAAADTDNYWLAFYRRRGHDSFTIIERVGGVSVVRAGSGVDGPLSSDVAPMWIEIAADELSISAGIGTFSPLTYTPGGAIARKGTNAGAMFNPTTAPSGEPGFNHIKVIP